MLAACRHAFRHAYIFQLTLAVLIRFRKLTPHPPTRGESRAISVDPRLDNPFPLQEADDRVTNHSHDTLITVFEASLPLRCVAPGLSKLRMEIQRAPSSSHVSRRPRDEVRRLQLPLCREIELSKMLHGVIWLRSTLFNSPAPSSEARRRRREVCFLRIEVKISRGGSVVISSMSMLRSCSPGRGYGPWVSGLSAMFSVCELSARSLRTFPCEHRKER